jgi:hypothetical protein
MGVTDVVMDGLVKKRSSQKVSKILDNHDAGFIADAIIAELEWDGGYSVEEMVPGLIRAIIQLADAHPEREQILNEASNLLADA